MHNDIMKGKIGEGKKKSNFLVTYSTSHDCISNYIPKNGQYIKEGKLEKHYIFLTI